MPINKNAIKLAQMLDLNVEKAEKLFDTMSLSDLAALTTAVNSDDFLTVREIFNRYKHEIDNLPNPQEVKKYYDDQLMVNSDADEALASTADFFGIRGEDVEMLIGKVTENEKKDREPLFIPDTQVARAYKNVKEMLAGGASDGSLMEVKRAWQRRMLYGLIDPVTASVIQKTIDLTPLAAMQQYCMIHGYGEPALEESQMSLEAMMDKIIEDHLHNIDKDAEDEVIVTMDMGTVEPKEKDGQLEELDAPGLKFNTVDYNGWDLRWSKAPVKDKNSNEALYRGIAYRKHCKSLEATGKSAQAVESQLKQLVDNNKGANELSGSKATIDFNTQMIKQIIGHADTINCDIQNHNGTPILIIGAGPYTAMDRHANRTKEEALGQHAFNIPIAVAKEAGLKNARYTIDKNAGFSLNGGTAYELKHASDVNNNRVKMKEPGITVAKVKVKESIVSLIDKITKKRF